MKHLYARLITIIFLLTFILISAAAGEEQTITYRDYGGKFSAPIHAQQIDLGRLKVENFDAFERFLDELPDLRRVDMYATHMRRKEAARLSERYPQIEFGWTLYFGDHTIRTDQTVFSTRHDGVLKRHTSQVLDVLRYCRSLIALDLGHNDLTDISFLSELSNLRLLILADNQIEDLSALSRLKNLEYIELFDNHVASIEPLLGLDRLMDLNIAQNRVSSLLPLQNMPSLKRLWLYASTGKQEAPDAIVIESLQSTLSHTQIDAQSPGTEGGWRIHPHYDVLFQVFRSEQYVPFEDSFQVP